MLQHEAVLRFLYPVRPPVCGCPTVCLSLYHLMNSLTFYSVGSMSNNKERISASLCGDEHYISLRFGNFLVSVSNCVAVFSFQGGCTVL